LEKIALGDSQLILFAKYLQGYKIKGDEVGGAYSTNGRDFKRSFSPTT
jgi:hypothetical protein